MWCASFMRRRTKINTWKSIWNEYVDNKQIKMAYFKAFEPFENWTSVFFMSKCTNHIYIYKVSSLQLKIHTLLTWLDLNFIHVKTFTNSQCLIIANVIHQLLNRNNFAKCILMQSKLIRKFNVFRFDLNVLDIERVRVSVTSIMNARKCIKMDKCWNVWKLWTV